MANILIETAQMVSDACAIPAKGPSGGSVDTQHVWNHLVKWLPQRSYIRIIVRCLWFTNCKQPTEA